ncbi:arginine N-succinyltransferase [Sphingomonas montana]|uniref:arginine N-succinyltransferase n=1 Tax=Sphingomonas montana TaxID=1843236 RepID=UPI00096D6E0B|nr:arginine N-succinyltransferase [Sphingomonas montana]
MTAQVRMVRADDIAGLLTLSALTGGGMTNLPNDRDALSEKIAWSTRSAETMPSSPQDEYYMLVLEDAPGGRIIGTASLYSRLGARLPFYSYKLGRVTHASSHPPRSFSTQLLFLVNDYDGASEVGGLFVHADARVAGYGRLLARSRYLLIARHRAAFADRTIADLRGYAANGASPFWKAVGEPFFGSDFEAADLHNALHGNQFIADLMPRYPIYTSLLPADARDAIGRPHDDSRAALRLLEQEGFSWDGYVDIFDGGPTVSARTDQIAAIRDCISTPDGRTVIADGPGRYISAQGHGPTFVATIEGAS